MVLPRWNMQQVFKPPVESVLSAKQLGKNGWTKGESKSRSVQTVFIGQKGSKGEEMTT